MTALGIRYVPLNDGADPYSASESREWPPVPGRVFMAIAATYFARADESERQALQWLGSAGTPAVSAIGDAGVHFRAASSPVQIGARTADLMSHAVYLVWDSEIPPHLRAGLERLCQRVNRIGQSSTPVEMWIADRCEIRGEAQPGNPVSARPANGTDPRIHRALAVLARSFSDPALDLRRVSRAVGMSEAHLGRLFKKRTGLCFRQYLRNVRIDRAARLLLTSTDHVKSIAIGVGYRSHSHFGRDFRACFGQPPQKFRDVDRAEAPLSHPLVAKGAAGSGS